MHIETIIYIEELPQDCIESCSHPGPCDDDVEFWRKRLDLTVDRQNAIKCLEGYGAWEIGELSEFSDERLAETVLWLACGNFAEWDGTENSPCGSDIFVLE